MKERHGEPEGESEEQEQGASDSSISASGQCGGRNDKGAPEKVGEQMRSEVPGVNTNTEPNCLTTANLCPDESRRQAGPQCVSETRTNIEPNE